VIKLLINKNVIYEKHSESTAAFANSATANTQKTIDLTMKRPIEIYAIIINNPSTVTDLTVKVFNKEVFGEDTKYAYITSFTVPKSQALTGTTIDTYLVLVEGMFIGGDVRLVVSNNTALGASEGFTSTFRIREVV